LAPAELRSEAVLHVAEPRLNIADAGAAESSGQRTDRLFRERRRRARFACVDASDAHDANLGRGAPDQLCARDGGSGSVSLLMGVVSRLSSGSCVVGALREFVRKIAWR
jgi:hypothetical protein